MTSADDVGQARGSPGSSRGPAVPMASGWAVPQGPAGGLGVLAVGSAGCVRAVPVDPVRLGGLALTSTVLAADGTVLAHLHAEHALDEHRRKLREGHRAAV